jgi:ADP-ribose pyrophosphatase
VFEGAIFSVHRETWTGVDYPVDVVRHVGACGVLPITPNGDVLLVEQFRPAIRRRLLEIPAGLLDRDREDARACAARELLEETGYRHRWIEPLGGIYSSAGFTDEFVHLFWAGTDREADHAAEPGIVLQRKRFEDMVARAREGRVEDAKTAVALLLAAERHPSW